MAFLEGSLVGRAKLLMVKGGRLSLPLRQATHFPDGVYCLRYLKNASGFELVRCDAQLAPIEKIKRERIVEATRLWTPADRQVPHYAKDPLASLAE